MNLQTITDDAPGTVLFPEYAELYELIAREVAGLTDAQLDFTSDQWNLGRLEYSACSATWHR